MFERDLTSLLRVSIELFYRIARIRDHLALARQEETGQYDQLADQIDQNLTESEDIVAKTLRICQPLDPSIAPTLLFSPLRKCADWLIAIHEHLAFFPPH